jgi:hypothetical protein
MHQVPIKRSMVLRTVMPRFRKERKLRATAIVSPAIAPEKRFDPLCGALVCEACDTSQSIRAPTMISSVPRVARKAATRGASRPFRKLIETLLSTTINGSRAPCGSAPNSRASGICRMKPSPPVVAAT